MQTLPLLAALLCAAPFAILPESSGRTLEGAAAALSGPVSARDEFPEEWFWRQGGVGAAHRAMVGKPPPPLTVSKWRGDEAAIAAIVGKDGKGDPWANLRGRVVVVDFWATWCGPCMAAIPENVELVRTHAADGLVILGVHDSARGSENIPTVAASNKINYPLAVDSGGKSTKAWNVGFWPTYAVIDRKGIVRAVGLQPNHVREVVVKLLAEPAESAVAGKERPTQDAAKPAPKPSGAGVVKPSGTPAVRKQRIARELLEGDGRRRGAVARFDQCPPAPSLGAFSKWTPAGEAVGKATSLEELKGKIVVLDFWATWCGPCIASIPKNNALAKKYADKGVVLVGVCHPEGGEKMLDTVRSKGIEYTVCLDTRGEAIANYVVDSYPDYYIIDRDGHLRGADIGNGNLEAAIEALLAEDAAKDGTGGGTGGADRK